MPTRTKIDVARSILNIFSKIRILREAENTYCSFPARKHCLKKQVPEQAIGDFFSEKKSRSLFATCPAITIFLVVINSRNDLSRQNRITLVLRNPKSIENSSHNRLSKLDSSFGVSENCSQSVQVSFEGNPLIACSGTCFFKPRDFGLPKNQKSKSD